MLLRAVPSDFKIDCPYAVMSCWDGGKNILGTGGGGS